MTTHDIRIIVTIDGHEAFYAAVSADEHPGGRVVPVLKYWDLQNVPRELLFAAAAALAQGAVDTMIGAPQPGLLPPPE